MTDASSGTRMPGAGFLSREATILTAFFFQAFAAGGMFTRIPDIQQGLGISEGELGLAIMGQPIGALSSFLFSSLIIEHIGTRRMLMFGLPMIVLSVLALAAAPNLALAFVAFGLFGASFALANVAMNVEADRVEAASGRRMMNRCHGMWSLGFLIASLIGAGARGIPISPIMHFSLVLPIIVIVSAFVLNPMQASPPRAHKGPSKKRVFVTPTLSTIMLVGFGMAAVFVEGGTRNWSVIYMRDSFSAPDLVDTLTLPAFLLMLTIGRLLADRWIERFGPVRVAACLISLALVGLSQVIFAGSLWQALFGFGLMGIGICVIYPLTMTAAAQLGDREASQNVAAVTMTTTIVMLGAPAMMGFIADSFGIRAAFGAMLPVLTMSLLLVRMVRPPPPANTD